MVGIRVRGARHEGGPGRNGLLQRVDRIIHRAPEIRLALETERRRGRGLLLGQAINPVIHHHVGQLDVFAGRVGEMVAADGEGIAVPAEHEHVQVGTRERNAAGERQRATVDEVDAVRLHEIREPAGAADAGDGGDLLVDQLALFNQFEIQGEHGEVTAARAPRRVVGGDFFFGQALAFLRGGRIAGRGGRCGQSLAHTIVSWVGITVCANRRTRWIWRVRESPSPSR